MNVTRNVYNVLRKVAAAATYGDYFIDAPSDDQIREVFKGKPVPKNIFELAKKHRELAGQQWDIESKRDLDTMDLEDAEFDLQQQMMDRIKKQTEQQNALFNDLYSKGVDRRSQKFRDTRMKLRMLDREVNGILSPYRAKLNRLQRRRGELEAPYNRQLEDVFRRISEIQGTRIDQ